MAQLVIPNLDENVTARLQQRARNHGRTTKEEARAILVDAVTTQATPTERLGSKLQARFAAIGLDEDIAKLRGRPAHAADLSG